MEINVVKVFSGLEIHTDHETKRVYHEGFKCAPYETMFGSPIKMGIATSAISKDMIRLLISEEDLENLLNNLSR